MNSNTNKMPAPGEGRASKQSNDPQTTKFRSFSQPHSVPFLCPLAAARLRNRLIILALLAVVAFVIGGCR